MNASRILRSAVVLSCTASLYGQTLVRSVNGPTTLARFGSTSVLVTDQNGDGIRDVLVGAPGFNSERGALYCVSGAYLMNGAGAQFLWSLAPAVNVGDQFGAALADVGDRTGDGVPDFLVGQPGFDNGSSSDAGAVRLVNGATRAIVSLIQGSSFGRLGQSLAACGDVNGNASIDVVIGVPYQASGGRVYVIDGNSLSASATVTSIAIETVTSGSNDWDVGYSVSGGADLNGDGVPEIVIGAPFSAGNNAPGAGAVIVYDPVTNMTRKLYSSITGERLGTSVSVGDDYDGDGVADIVVGAPNFQNGTGYAIGRAVVLSGARAATGQLPYEIRSVPFASSVAPPLSHNDPDPDFHFGTAVRALADLNGDGVGEYMVGAPDYFTPGFPTGWSFRGAVRIFSGATGTQLNSIFGGTTDRLGDGPGCSIIDLNGDGLRELVVTGSRSDAGGTDSGVLRCYRLFPIPATTYCTAKVNSLGCSPGISASGSASASSGTAFVISCSQVLNNKNGLLFFAHSPAFVPFQGGTKCTGNPVVRTLVQSSGGSPTGNDCSGTFGFDFNALIVSGAHSTLRPGAEVYAQYWSRDPASSSTTSLSDALQFVVNP